ncbi:ribosome biogenesis protein WDR12 homolog isoform X1 [Asparagus officinalis]|nr:ribosome biogenesis protein WDR12 homolog isoform X1 [Asparagus officinalis]
MDTNGSDSSRQIQVRFVTKLEPPLKAPASSIAVPSYLNRMGLSEIVNSLLKSVSSEFEPQPFDFLVDGELVWMSLEQFLLAKGISAERVLEIEYIKVVAPREQKDPCLHDDWVSAVDGSDPRFILTGCYDNISRIWKVGSLCTHILEGHTGAVTSVSILNTTAGVENGNIRLATGSKDRTLRLWMLDVAGKVDYPMKIGAYKVLNGHMASVQSISSAPLGDKICSGSWDCSVKLWKVNDSEVEGDSVSIKKRKLVSDMVEESQAEIEAMSSFVGHTQCVSSVTWPELETIYSASWDHSIRSWDVETGKSPWNMVSGKVLNCLDVGGRELIAAGGSDPILRIWDPRKPGTLAPIFQFSSHTSWITACKWHSSSQFHLVSASYDGKVMLWDLRTAWPLAVIDSHKDKVLCVDWWKGDSVVSGGADSKLCISSGISIQ